MSKIPVRLGFFNLWYNKMTARRFFKNMPYMFSEFNFIETGRKDFVICGAKTPPASYQRIFYTCDNIRPLMHHSEWGLGFDYRDKVKNPRYFRFPNYVRLGAGANLIKKPVDVEKLIERKTKFCAFIYHHNVPIRNNFFRVLSRYKRVDAPGAACHNSAPIGNYSLPGYSRKSPRVYQEKVEFLKDYKFCIAFENSSYPGYTTEKIYHAMLAGCIPIYWGNPLIKRDFNSKSMVHPYGSRNRSMKTVFDRLIERVKQIDNDIDLYSSILQEPWYHKNKVPNYASKKHIINMFKKIFTSK